MSLPLLHWKCLYLLHHCLSNFPTSCLIQELRKSWKTGANERSYLASSIVSWMAGFGMRFWGLMVNPSLIRNPSLSQGNFVLEWRMLWIGKFWHHSSGASSFTVANLPDALRWVSFDQWFGILSCFTLQANWHIDVVLKHSLCRPWLQGPKNQTPNRFKSTYGW